VPTTPCCLNRNLRPRPIPHIMLDRIQALSVLRDKRRQFFRSPRAGYNPITCGERRFDHVSPQAACTACY